MCAESFPYLYTLLILPKEQEKEKGKKTDKAILLVLLFMKASSFDTAEALLQATAQPFAEAATSAHRAFAIIPAAFERGDGTTAAAMSGLHLNALGSDVVVTDGSLLQGLFNAVAGLAFALDIFGEILDARPSLIGAALGTGGDHHIVAFFVAVHVAHWVLVSRRIGGDAVERPMAHDAVDNFLSGRGLERLGVGVGNGGKWPVGRIVPRIQGGVVGASVMPGRATCVVQVVDDVRWDVMFLGGIACAVGRGLFFRQLIQWPV